MDFSRKFLQVIKQAYEPHYGRTLTEREIFEIATNLAGFFGLLVELEEEDARSKDGKQSYGDEQSKN